MALDVSRELLGRIDGNVNYATYQFPVANGVTVNAGDFVYFSSGAVTSATIAGARPIGVVTGAVSGGTPGSITGNASLTNTVLVCVDNKMRYLLKNDNIGTTFATTHVGQYFDLIGATGNQLVDTSTVSTTLGTVICLEFNPQIDPVASDATYGVFLLINSALAPYVAG